MSEKGERKWKVKAIVAILVAGGAIFGAFLAQREAVVESLLKWHLRDSGLEDVMLQVGAVHLTYLEVESFSFKHGEQKVFAGPVTVTYTIRELLTQRRLRRIWAQNLHVAISFPFRPEDERELPEAEELRVPERLPFDLLQLGDSHLSVSLGETTHDIYFSLEVETGGNESGRTVVSGEASVPGVGASFAFLQEMEWNGQGRPSLSGTIEVPSFYLNSESLGEAFQAMLSGYSFEGWITAQGRTSWNEGQWDAAGIVTVQELSAANEEGDFELNGIFSAVEFASVRNLRTFPKQEVFFSSLREGGLLVENGTVVFDMEGFESIDVHSVYLNWGEGIVYAAPFSLRLDSPDFVLTIDVEGIELARILELVPDFPAQGEGRLEGRLSVHIHPDGFDLQPGNLQLMTGTRGRLRIERPGLLTEGMSSDHPDFERRRMTETALRNVEFSQFSITLFPEGQPGTALVMEFLAEPVEESRIREVPVSLYLHADLRQLLRIGASARIQVE